MPYYLSCVHDLKTHTGFQQMIRWAKLYYITWAGGALQGYSEIRGISRGLSEFPI